jgi:hypothetical protein
MQMWRVQLGMLAVGIALAGCEHHPLRAGGNDASAPAVAVPVDQFIPRYLEANCVALVNCRIWPSRETCEADLLPTYVRSLQNTVAAVAAGRIHYDPDAAMACLLTVAAQQCVFGAAAPACATVFSGTLGDGSRCIVNNECTSRRCGGYPAGGGCCAVGTCLPRVAPGQSCTVDDYCTDGFYCGESAVGPASTCRPLLMEGQPCATQIECDSSLRCDRVSGTCVSYSPLGAVCTAGVPTCDRIIGYCDSGTCQLWRDVGQPCQAVAGDPSGTCVRYAACKDGTCALLPGLGESCSAPAGGDAASACRAGTCRDGTCQATACPVCTLESAATGDAAASR